MVRQWRLVRESGQRICRSYWPVIGAALALPATLCMPAQELPNVRSEAPADHALLKWTFSGGFLVGKPLKKCVERADTRRRMRKADLDSARTRGAEGVRECAELQLTLDGLRQQTDAKKVFVPSAIAHAD